MSFNIRTYRQIHHYPGFWYLIMVRKQKSLTVNAILTVINRVSGVLFPLLTFPYVSRILQPDGVGKLNFAQALVGYFAMIASIGIPLYGVREVAKVCDDKQKLSQLVVELVGLHNVMTVIAFCAFGMFWAFSDRVAADPILFCLCLMPMLFDPWGLGYLFSGLEEVFFVTVRTLIFRILSVIAIFSFIHEANDLRIYVLINGVNAAVVTLVNLSFARRQLVLRKVDWRNLRIWKHLKPALIVFAMGVVVAIYTSLDKVMLGYLSDDAQVGYYSVADRLIRVVVMLLTTLVAVVLPRVSYYLDNNHHDEYRKLANFSLRIISFLSFPAAAGLFVLAGPLVFLFFGETFGPSSPLLQIMGVNVIFIALGSFLSFQVIYPENKERLLIFSASFGAIFNVVLNVLLIPRWNAAGAAVATLIAEGAVTTALIFLCKPFKKFDWPLRQMGGYCVTSVLMAIGVFFLMRMHHNAVVQVAIGVAGGAIIYFGAMLARRDEVLCEVWEKVSAIKGHFKK